MAMKTVNDIRKEYLEFFEKNGHTIVPSSPLVPQNDPTLMFVNSGMVQFKDVFTGKEKRDYTRATTAQKSVRAGGKHNDLDNIGYTARHLTFFEMMGNFSFGDYFKEEAIAYAWEFVTKNLALPPEKLTVTVHVTDEEAAGLWKTISGLGDEKIIRIPTDDNFWMMGDTGPCGPCSEIFYDHGEHVPGGPPGSAEEDLDRFVEIWNLVFMQFEQEPDGEGGYTRTPLPKPSIDTGMGLDRTSTVIQGKIDVFDIDLLRSIIEHSADLTGISPDSDMAASHRVIADHLRCAAFLLADGVMPSNEGRGYVLRRIMRRGMRHAHLLGAEDPLMYRLVPTLTGLMGEAYPELRRAEDMITETLKLEETRFKKTLDRGLKLLEEETAKLSSGHKFPGEAAFKLYDTYGFPVDLTQDALRAQGIEVDMDAFDACMDKQKAQARKSWAGSGDAATDKLWFDLLETHGATEFLGYKTEAAEGQVIAIIKDGVLADSLSEGDDALVVTNQTPFYAESGGQVGDTGIMIAAGGATFAVKDVKKQAGKLWAHAGTLTKGTLSVENGVELRVDGVRRTAIRANHSATHLLHEALRETLGGHVAQKGSLQDEERTRFDISHNHAITAEEIATIEQMVNDEIRLNTTVQTRVMPLEEAMEQGAMALFGEKYDDEVRVVSMGSQPAGANKPFSVELCGGTHVQRTGDIGLFKIVAESAVSAGVRRIEALTGDNALRYFEEQEQLVRDTAAILRTAPAELAARATALMNERKKLEKQVAELRRQLATGGGAADSGDGGADIKEIGGVKFTAKVLADFPPKDLKPMADELKTKIGSGVITLIATNEGKASIVVGVTPDLTDKISAVELVKIGAEKLGGKGGGGRPDMAQAGGPDADAANDALNAIESSLVS